MRYGGNHKLNNPEVIAYLVTFTEEILNGKLHSLVQCDFNICNVIVKILLLRATFEFDGTVLENR